VLKERRAAGRLFLKAGRLYLEARSSGLAAGASGLKARLSGLKAQPFRPQGQIHPASRPNPSGLEARSSGLAVGAPGREEKSSGLAAGGSGLALFPAKTAKTAQNRRFSKLNLTLTLKPCPSISSRFTDP